MLKSNARAVGRKSISEYIRSRCISVDSSDVESDESGSGVDKTAVKKGEEVKTISREMKLKIISGDRVYIDTL